MASSPAKVVYTSASLSFSLFQLTSDAKKGEWLRISVLLKEANAISVGLHQVCAELLYKSR
jgi:hypothetical protein